MIDNASGGMFTRTLGVIDEFLKNLLCNKCLKPSDNLRFIGTSCKHVFCWSCINNLENSYFVLCPICSLPVNPQHSSSAHFVRELHEVLLSLKKSIGKLNEKKLVTAEILTAIEPEKQTRTTEEFCSSQQPINGNFERNLSDKSEIQNAAKELSSDIRTSRSFDPIKHSTSEISLFTQFLDEGNDYEEVKMTQEPFLRNLSPTLLCSITPVQKPPSSPPTIEKRRVKVQHDQCFRTCSTARNSFGSKKKCVLINAIIRGNRNNLLDALKNDEDANECDNLGYTALYHAAAQNNVELCELLIDNGALINAHSGELCETALHAAVRWNAVNVTRYLLDAGADWRAVNLKGETALDLTSDDEMKAAFNEKRSVSRIVYTFRSLKACSVYLCAGLDNKLLTSGKQFLEMRNAMASSLSSATHVVVSSRSTTAEIDVDILEAMLRGLYILSSSWLQGCLKAREIIDEEKHEVRALTRQGELVADGTCTKARRNALQMKPQLFRGCHFYLCRHNYRPFLAEDLKRLVLSGGGVVLGREPSAENYAQSGLRPFHGSQSAGEKQITGLFAVYMPGQYIPSRIVDEKRINLITPIWIYDCAAKLELLKPERL